MFLADGQNHRAARAGSCTPSLREPLDIFCELDNRREMSRPIESRIRFSRGVRDTPGVLASNRSPPRICVNKFFGREARVESLAPDSIGVYQVSVCPVNLLPFVRCLILFRS